MDSGVYAIKNKINDKLYVGSTRAFHARKREHYSQLRRGQHHNPHLQNAWKNMVRIIPGTTPPAKSRATETSIQPP